MATVWSVLMLIDGAIYNLICYVYEIFYYLATLNIFTEEHYQGIVNRIYVVLGLFMLFVLAYSLLRAIIDPDNFAKKENSFPNLIKNVIISLVIIVLLPTVFSVAFNIQNAVLNNDTIPKLILGLDGATDDTSGGGRTIAYYLFKAFLYPNSDYCTSEGYTDIEECRDSIKGNGWLFVTNGDQLTVMDQAVLNGSSFTNYNDYSESVRDGKLSYLFPISTVAGIFTLYVLLNFCFDMAIRVVKLAFYQIIAPIPVICRVMPGGSMKDVFNKWVKQIISIFLEVFIRIAVLAIGIYLINIVVETYNNGLPNIDSLGLTQRPIVLALIIMGIVIFMKQAPQILGDLLGLKTDGMKLGLMDKLAMGGGLLAGAAVGGGLTSGVRNLVGGIKGTAHNVKNASGFRGKAGALIGGTLGAAKSTIGGAGSGFVRGGFAGRGAKNFKDMRGAASTAAKGAAEARTKRENYKAAHRKKIPVVGGIIGAGLGHGADLLGSAGRFVGLGNIDALRAENAAMAEITGAEDAFNNEFESTLLKSLNKGKTSLAGANLSTFSAAKQRLDQARLSGVNVAGAEKAYKDAIKDVQKSLHNKLYSSQSNWNKLSQDDQIALGQLRVKATEYRGAIMNNSSLQALRDAGIVGSDFAMNKDVSESVFYDPVDANGNAIRDAQGNVIKSVVSKMGDNIKLHTASNDVNISAMKQKNTDENKK